MKNLADAEPAADDDVTVFQQDSLPRKVQPAADRKRPIKIGEPVAMPVFVWQIKEEGNRMVIL